jgi:hypothetical protein
MIPKVCQGVYEGTEFDSYSNILTQTDKAGLTSTDWEIYYSDSETS